MTSSERAIDGAGDRLAYDGSHAAADEVVLHHTEDNVVWAKLADGVDNRVVETGLALGFGEAFLVWLQVGELKRISGPEPEVDKLIARFEEIFNPGAGVDAEVMAAV